MPDCIGNHGGPDNGDCDPSDPSSETGWTPECPNGPPCEFCCDTYRDQCWTCHVEDNDGNCIHGCNLECEAGCVNNFEWTWGCDNVCYETEEDAPIIDLCGVCGGDGSSCGSGD